MDNLAREAQMREETKRVALLADEFVVGGGAWVQCKLLLWACEQS